jgi:hypothetical protein
LVLLNLGKVKVLQAEEILGKILSAIKPQLNDQILSSRNDGKKDLPFS